LPKNRQLSSLNPIGTPFIELPTVDSTNNYAMGLVRAAMAHHGTAVFAHDQTSGKGQRNRQWTSEKNQNIALSVLLEPAHLNCPHLFVLSMAIATAVHKFLSFYVKGDIKIKWPNDIYWRDRKAAGILIENVWQGNEWKFAIAGIGININQSDFGTLHLKAVSLKQIIGKELEPLALAKELCHKIDVQLSALAADASAIIGNYKESLYKLGEQVRLKKGSRVFDACIKDVSINGELIVESAAEERFAVGEVEWII
jgi:BirA family biotin operon repressor/biotin-[acetyl-CoA-carboxylase] ligase